MMDLQAIREEFAITRNYSFMNHASVAPLPRRSVEAIQSYLQQQHEKSYVEAGYRKKVEQVRTLTAQLINAAPDEIALVKNTTEGISFVANGLKWNPGDNIVTTSVEFPSNMYPWMNVQSRGAQIRTVLEENGRIPLENLIEAIDRHTRVVAISAAKVRTCRAARWKPSNLTSSNSMRSPTSRPATARKSSRSAP